MAEVSICAKQDQVEKIGNNLARSDDKTGKTGVPGPDDAPKKAQQDEHTYRVAGPDMEDQDIVFRQVGDGEAKRDDPMRQPYKRIPNANHSPISPMPLLEQIPFGLNRLAIQTEPVNLLNIYGVGI